MEGGKGDVRALRPLDQQRLDIGLGEHAAPAGDAVDGLALSGQLLELVGGDAEQGGDLVDEGTGATGAAAVHAHIGGLEAAGGLVKVEENHLGVLAAQLHGGADGGVQGPDGGGVGHHLLDIVGAQGGSDGPSAGAAHSHPEPGTGKPPGRFREKLPDGLGLMGVVPLVAGEEDAVVGGVQDDRLDGGGPYVHTQPQDIGFAHSRSFRGNAPEGCARPGSAGRTKLSENSHITNYSELF